jgi:hypothetical protein
MVAALNTAGALSVGEDTSEDNPLLNLNFSIGYTSAGGESPLTQVVVVWEGNFFGGEWTAPRTDQESYAGEDRTYTLFQAVPIPAAAWLFGLALLGLAGIARKR